MTMLIKDAYILLQKFCKEALNDNNIKVYLGNQFATRAKKPSVTINIDNCKEVSAFNQFVDGDGLKTYEILKTIDVTFTSYADDVTIASDMLCKIYNMFFTELTFTIFGRNLSLLKKISEITTTSIKVEDKIEDRATMELRFNIVQVAQYNTGLIEHVEVHDQINNEIYYIDL